MTFTERTDEEVQALLNPPIPQTGWGMPGTELFPWLTSQLPWTGDYVPTTKPAPVKSTDELIQEQLKSLEGTGLPEDQAKFNNNVIKALHFDEMTGEAAFVKFINWLTQNSVSSVQRTGAPLGEALVFGTPERPSPFAEPGRETEIIDLVTEAGQQRLKNYFLANWTDTPELVELVRGGIEANWAEFTSVAAGTGMRPSGWDAPGIGNEEYQMIMQQFGGFGDDTAVLASIDSVYGAGSAQDIIGGVLDAALDGYVDNVASRHTTMLLGPEPLTGLEAAPTEGEEPEMAGRVAFITSFDGTPYGDIESVNDLFSGGKIGPMNAADYMLRLYNNTKDRATGYSAVIEKIQQELFAWGYITEPAEWGKLEITNLLDAQGRTMVEPTIDAVQMIQADIINTGIEVARDPNVQLAPDGSIYLEQTIQRMIGRSLNVGETVAASRKTQERAVVEQVRERIVRRMYESDRTITEQGMQGLDQTISEMITELTPGQQEEFFGRGGGQKQQRLVDSVMSQFYKDEDWRSRASWSGRTYTNYAKNVGALTADQVSLLERGMADLEGEDFLPGEEQAYLRSMGDVARANFLKFVSKQMVEEGRTFDDLTADDVRRGLITYGHTMGQYHAGRNGYSDRDYARMADVAFRTVSDPIAEPSIVGTLDERLAEEMGLMGGGVGTGFEDLMGAVRRRRGAGGRLRVRNV